MATVIRREPQVAGLVEGQRDLPERAASRHPDGAVVAQRDGASSEAAHLPAPALDAVERRATSAADVPGRAAPGGQEVRALAVGVRDAVQRRASGPAGPEERLHRAVLGVFDAGVLLLARASPRGSGEVGLVRLHDPSALDAHPAIAHSKPPVRDELARLLARVLDAPPRRAGVLARVDVVTLHQRDASVAAAPDLAHDVAGDRLGAPQRTRARAVEREEAVGVQDDVLVDAELGARIGVRRRGAPDRAHRPRERRRVGDGAVPGHEDPALSAAPRVADQGVERLLRDARASTLQELDPPRPEDHVAAREVIHAAGGPEHGLAPDGPVSGVELEGGHRRGRGGGVRGFSRRRSGPRTRADRQADHHRHPPAHERRVQAASRPRTAPTRTRRSCCSASRPS